MTTASKPQQQAIQHNDGPLLIIAGPGAGKTFTLVERVVYLVKEEKVSPESLLIVTFTEKAAQELTTRISNRLLEERIDFNINEMYLGTFHGICLRMIEDYREYTRLKRSFTLFDQFDQQYFLYQNMNVFRKIEDVELILGKATSGRWYQSEQLLKWLNKATEEVLIPDTLVKAPEAQIQALGRCLEKYHELLLEHNALDFASIQYEALQLLEQHPDVLEKLRSQLQNLMVDEYQDTNTIQERILKLLMGENHNLCVVGDDDQGLYRFRGATIRNILEFPTLFPTNECKQVTLTTNYRSHAQIIDFYNKWMTQTRWVHNGKSFRYDKEILPEEREFPEYPAVISLGGKDSFWEEETLDFLHSLKDSGQLTDWNQVAFLFKSVRNRHVVSLARHLEENGIPVYSPRSNMFFDREEIRLLIGALIFLFPQFPKVRKWNATASLEIWEWYDEMCVRPFANELKKPENIRLLEWARPLAKKHYTLTGNTDYSFSGLFYQLLQFPLFSRHLDEGALEGVDKGRASRNIATFSKLLVKFEYLHRVTVLNPKRLDSDIKNLFNQFFRYLKDGGINEYEDESEYAPSGCVSFLTIHQSKGLEFPIVITGSLESSPRKQFTEIDQILEEGYYSKPPFEPLENTKFYDYWRLFYTAFSRAQNLLVLATSKKPSKYFERLFDSVPRWNSSKFDPSLLELEQVKEINLKKEYSFTSHITFFENCAEQYRFFKELEFTQIRAGAQMFGTLVHQTIEDIHKAVLRGDDHLLNADQINTWFDTNYYHLSKAERQYLAPSSLKAAVNHVLRYFNREQKHFDRLQEAEVDISLVKDAYILTGSVDLIRGEGGTVELIDFKSEKKPDMEKDQERLQRYRRQLEVYAHLVEERTGHEVSRMHLYYTGEEDSNPYVSFPKDGGRIDRTIDSFDKIVQRIEKRDYCIKERPSKLCVECDMQAYCDMKNWNFCEG